MADCFSTLGASIMNDCNENKGKGFEGKAWIVDRSSIDWDSVIRTGNVLSDIPLLTGKKGYEVHYPGKTPFTGATDTISELAFGTVVDRSVPILLAADSPLNNKSVDELRASSYVLILEKKAKGIPGPDYGKQAFKVFGFEQGLYVTEGTQDYYSDDSNGGWLLTLTEAQAPTSGLFLFKTDYTTTKTALDTLLVGE